MNSSQFEKNQIKKLSSILGCKPEEIKSICNNLKDYYKEWEEVKISKATGEPKRYIDGTIKRRIFMPSLNRLKQLQSVVKDKILIPINVPKNVHGGVKKRNNITNAKAHQGNKYQFTTDLRDFYPRVTNKKVFEALLDAGLSNHFAYWITKLTTYKYQLPQGAPTSTHIANIIFLTVDKELIGLCEKNNITYTRYVDDLTFSSQQDFKFLINDFLKIIKKWGFNINYRKTEYSRNQSITGITVFNNYIDVPKSIKTKAKNENLSDKIIKPYTNYMNRIRNTNKGIKKK